MDSLNCRFYYYYFFYGHRTIEQQNADVNYAVRMTVRGRDTQWTLFLIVSILNDAFYSKILNYWQTHTHTTLINQILKEICSILHHHHNDWMKMGNLFVYRLRKSILIETLFFNSMDNYSLRWREYTMQKYKTYKSSRSDRASTISYPKIANTCQSMGTIMYTCTHMCTEKGQQQQQQIWNEHYTLIANNIWGGYQSFIIEWKILLNISNW